MDEIEVPLENAQEQTMHRAKHAEAPWINGVALTSAILAVLAAITALLAGQHANEAMIQQIRASDHWAYYQAKSIKSSLLASKIDTFVASGQRPLASDLAKLATYKAQMNDITKEAKAREEEATQSLKLHEVYAHGVTLFQVAIAIAAIAALTNRRWFWVMSLVFGVGGVIFLVKGILLGH